ncbi:MAG: hypothetical protein V1688_03870 [bacterium]
MKGDEKGGSIMEWLNSFVEGLTPAMMLGIVLGFLFLVALMFWGKSLFGFLMGKKVSEEIIPSEPTDESATHFRRIFRGEHDDDDESEFPTFSPPPRFSGREGDEYEPPPTTPPSSSAPSTPTKKQLPKGWGKWLFGGLVFIFLVSVISTVFFIRGCGDKKPTQADFKQQTNQPVESQLKTQYGPQPTAECPQSELDRDTRGYVADARWQIKNGTLDNVEKWLKIAYDSLNQNSPVSLRSEITQLTGVLGALRLRAEEEKVKSEVEKAIPEKGSEEEQQ